MPRYINEDEFIAWVKEHWCADCQNDNGLRCRACWIDDAIDIVEEAPAADVVPKSEVDEIAEELSDTIVMKDELFDEVIKLRKELEAANLDVEVMGAELSRYTENLMQMRKQDKCNIASEIFTDIEKIINRYCKDYKYSIADVLLDIAEAKKKYMEKGGEE